MNCITHRRALPPCTSLCKLPDPWDGPKSYRECRSLSPFLFQSHPAHMYIRVKFKISEAGLALWGFSSDFSYSIDCVMRDLPCVHSTPTHFWFTHETNWFHSGSQGPVALGWDSLVVYRMVAKMTILLIFHRDWNLSVIAQEIFNPMILMPLPPKYSNYRYAPPHSSKSSLLGNEKLWEWWSTTSMGML